MNISKKDFNKAAIRVFCDIIKADGYIAKEELAEFAKIAKEYRLMKDKSGDTKNSKDIDTKTKQSTHVCLLGSLDAKIIQDAYTISFAKALEYIKSWDKEHHYDVTLFVKHLANLSTVDGECSPNEARIRLAVQYVLEKDAFVFSVSKDYKFSKKEAIFVENDIQDETIINSIEADCMQNKQSDI